MASPRQVSPSARYLAVDGYGQYGVAMSKTLVGYLLAVVAALSLIATACSDDSTASENTAADSAASASADSVDVDSNGSDNADSDDDDTENAESVSTTTEPESIVETTAETDSDNASEEPLELITGTVEAFVESKNLEGAGLIIVERDSGIIYEEYFGDFSADRISMIASSSKMISAGVLLKLQEEGLLDIDTPIEEQVDWAVGNPDITPAQLISNSSGLVGLGPNFLYAPYLCQWSAPTTLQKCGGEVFSSTEDDGDQIPPDTEFRYGGAQWQVAGAIAESVSGKSWEQLINEIYVEPCGVDSLGFISLGAVLTGASGYPTAFGGDPDGVTESANPSIEGGAYITAIDYAKLLQMHLNGGRCDGTQVLSQESLDTMHTDRIAAVYDGEAGSADFGYGMGWWINRDTGRISDGGAWGALPWLDLDDGYGAYIIVEDQSQTGQSLRGEIEELVHQAAIDT